MAVEDLGLGWRDR
uniref:Uncharacterized protein n=1 Tax=Arundo donax TaxID=35708 RepID=A0A0A9HF03_ARUDO